MAHHQRSMSAMAHHQRAVDMDASAHHQRSVAVVTTPTYDTMKGTAADVFPPGKISIHTDWTGNPAPGTVIGFDQKRGTPIRAGAVTQGRMPEVDYGGPAGTIIGYDQKRGTPIRAASTSVAHAAAVNDGDPLCYAGSMFIIGLGLVGGFLIAKQFAHYATGKATFV